MVAVAVTTMVVMLITLSMIFLNLLSNDADDDDDEDDTDAGSRRQHGLRHGGWVGHDELPEEGHQASVSQAVEEDPLFTRAGQERYGWQREGYKRRVRGVYRVVGVGSVLRMVEWCILVGWGGASVTVGRVVYVGWVGWG